MPLTPNHLILGRKDEMPNLAAGDVCLLRYEGKVGKGDYKLCKVEEMQPDNKGLVRTVTVAFRPLSAKKSLPYHSKELTKMIVGVNSVVLISCKAEKVFSNAENNYENNG